MSLMKSYATKLGKDEVETRDSKQVEQEAAGA